MRQIIFLAIFLFALSFILRIYQVGTSSQGIHADEASWGYNAYSILKTGKDEHGVKYPLVFEAFGDQKLPAYIYLTVPFIKIFDLVPFSVRLPSVIVGSLVQVVLFLLLKEWGYSFFLSFIGGLIVSISSWSIVLSRIWGFDSNLGLLFFLLALLATFYALNYKKKLFFVFGAIFFALSVYSYISFRLISPLTIFLIIACFFFKSRFPQKTLNLAIFTLFFIIIIFPFLIFPFYGSGTVRFKQVSFVPNLGTVLKINEERAFCTKFFPKFICYLISNKGESYFKLFLSRYGYIYSLNFLFFDGENNFPFLNINNQGLLPPLLFPFYILGLLVLFSQIINKKNWRKNFFLLGGLIISTLPANLVDYPQRVRLSALLPFVVILIMIGVNQLIIWLKGKINYKYIYLIITSYLLISGLFFFIKFLSIHLYKHEYVYRTYMKNLMLYLYRQPKQKRIFIRSIDEGITFYVFFNKIDPATFIKEVVRQKRSETGFVHPLRFQNIEQTHKSIEEIYCRCQKNNQHCLYIFDEDKERELGQAEKVFLTENKVYKLMYIYNLNKIKKGKIKCLY